MGLKSVASKIFASFIARRIKKWEDNAVEMQEKTMQKLIHSAANTSFGHDHQFFTIKNYNDFKSNIPFGDYESLRVYIDRMVAGEENVLWHGKPVYLAKTSGTTSGVKYIPISKQSMPHHIKAARNALLLYIHETGKADFVDGKMIFLQGSPELHKKNGVNIGRLSGIVAHHVPTYLQKSRMPSQVTNCIADWEQKVEAVVDETLPEKMSLISGIPPWVQMYFDRLSARTQGKKIKDIFPDFSLFVYGGVNFEPYRAKLEQSIGKKVDSIETYPASEGFIAFQDSQHQTGLLLNMDAGIFFEFIPVENFFEEKPQRIYLKNVELGVNYVILLNTDAGLWGYVIGDTVKFVSKKPYRIIVTGRVKHFISAFGEHVIAEEVESALLSISNSVGVGITEFTVAPQVNPENNELPYHEWLIEFEQVPDDIDRFGSMLDEALQQKNSYYADLIEGKILQPLKIRILKKGAFIEYMRKKGKLGGQNKVPRLSNDRNIADELIKLC